MFFFVFCCCCFFFFFFFLFMFLPCMPYLFVRFFAYYFCLSVYSNPKCVWFIRLPRKTLFCRPAEYEIISKNTMMVMKTQKQESVKSEPRPSDLRDSFLVTSRLPRRTDSVDAKTNGMKGRSKKYVLLNFLASSRPVVKTWEAQEA